MTPGIPRSLIGMTTVLCVAACAGVSPPTQTKQGPNTYAQEEAQAQAVAAPSVPYNLSGYGPMYKQGFVDGCKSVNGTQRRDNKLYGSDTNYKMGWNDGNNICSHRY